MIHKYVFRDKHIVMDVNSGAVHLVEPVLYEALDFYDGKECRKQELFDVLSARYSVLEIEDAVSDIDELISSGMLF